MNKSKWDNWTINETEKQIDKWVWKGKRNNNNISKKSRERINKRKESNKNNG